MSLIRPLVYIGILLFAASLKRKGVFGENDYKVVSKIFTNITLPANIVCVFAGFAPNKSDYWLIVIGFFFGLLPIFLMGFLRRSHNNLSRSFCMINGAGSNIGGFAMPIIQLFFGVQGAVLASIYDLGNALIMCGGGYAVTAAIVGLDNESTTKKDAVKAFLKKMFSSVSMDVYIIMLILIISGVKLPEIFGEITTPIANANGFVSMFMLGLMFKIEVENKEKITDVIFTLCFRVILGVGVGLLAYRFLPFEEITRKVIAICMVAPAGSISPVFTEQAGADPSLSSFLNSISVLISFAVMFILVYFVL